MFICFEHAAAAWRFAGGRSQPPHLLIKVYLIEGRTAALIVQLVEIPYPPRRSKRVPYFWAETISYFVILAQWRLKRDMKGKRTSLLCFLLEGQTICVPCWKKKKERKKRAKSPFVIYNSGSFVVMVTMNPLCGIEYRWNDLESSCAAITLPLTSLLIPHQWCKSLTNAFTILVRLSIFGKYHEEDSGH